MSERTASEIERMVAYAVLPEHLAPALVPRLAKLGLGELVKVLERCQDDISKLQELLKEKHGKGFTIPYSGGKLMASAALAKFNKALEKR